MLSRESNYSRSSNNFAADRAKQIKTKAIVNEDPTEALIRDLKAQNDALRAQLASGNVDIDDIKANSGKEELSKEELEKLKKEWLEEMKSQMDNNDNEVKELNLSHEEKVKAAKAAQVANPLLNQIMEDKKTKPHLFNLNFDPQLSGRIVHILQKPETEIGNRKGHESDILMIGPG